MIPDDLVPLSKIARQLHTTASRLARQSAVGEFPPVFQCVGKAWRVSQSAFEEWMRSRRADRVLAAMDQRALTIQRRARQVLDVRLP